MLEQQELLSTELSLQTHTFKSSPETTHLKYHIKSPRLLYQSGINYMIFKPIEIYFFKY